MIIGGVSPFTEMQKSELWSEFLLSVSWSLLSHPHFTLTRTNERFPSQLLKKRPIGGGLRPTMVFDHYMYALLRSVLLLTQNIPNVN